MGHVSCPAPPCWYLHNDLLGRRSPSRKSRHATRPGRAHSTSLLTRSIIMRYSGRSYESLAVEGAQAAGSSRMLSISLSSSPCSANVEANDG